MTGAGEGRSRTAYVLTDVTLHQDPEGRWRANHPAGRYEAWAPFIESFEEITLVGRASTEVSRSGAIVDGRGVVVHPVTGYHGLTGLLLHLPTLTRDLMKIGGPDDIFVGRLPEPLSLLAYCRARLIRAAYVSVVAADPEALSVAWRTDALGRGLGRVLRGLTRRIVHSSRAVIYVSQRSLQAKYPSAPDTPTLSRSNVILGENDFAHRNGSVPDAARPHRLVNVGQMTSPGKGHDLLLVAVQSLVAQGLDIELVLIGDGSLAPHLKEQADIMGLGKRVVFAGQIHARDELHALLDTADVYVSASRSEGLSRAMVEAMARSLPVVATRAGAEDEVLPSEVLVDVEDVSALCRALTWLANSPGRRELLGRENYRTARLVAERADPQLMADFLKDL